MHSQLGDILHQEQIKQLISKLRKLQPQEYATVGWFQQDEAMQKLNMQLHVNAVMKNDEYILEECVTQDKFRLIIYDLILTATWKQRVFPLLQPHAKSLNSLKIYLALYHESVVCNMLQVLMFHRTAVDESKDFLVEVIDYCYQKLTRQVSLNLRRRSVEREQAKLGRSEEEVREEIIKGVLKRSPWQELQNQFEEIEFGLFTMSLSILRYITDYLKHLQIGIIHHLLVECNLFAVLVPLIEDKPWMRVGRKQEREVFENGKWVIVAKGDYGRLPKVEAQVWIALYNLFMDPECRKKYELNDERKNTLLRLRKYLNESLLDQIPTLSYMLRSLEELSLMNVPTHLSMNPFVVQQVPVIASGLASGREWGKIAEEHAARLAQSMQESEKEHIGRLAELYSNSNVEGLLQGFKCRKCSKEAYKRCGKCKDAWYCSRECQLGDWPSHKLPCNERLKQAQQADERGAQKQKQKEVVRVSPVEVSVPPVEQQLAQSRSITSSSIDQLD